MFHDIIFIGRCYIAWTINEGLSIAEAWLSQIEDQINETNMQITPPCPECGAEDTMILSGRMCCSYCDSRARRTKDAESYVKSRGV